ncbi:MAG: alpha-xylosidase, partial [Clostridia bacterium]|nr:alpha-xylosidase [Clostridia bacterium]
MYVSSPQLNVIRIEAHHFLGCSKKMPSFDINDAGIMPEIEETAEKLIIKSGDTKLVINKRPSSFTYYYKDKKLTSIGNRFGDTTISTIKVQDEDFMAKQMDLDLGGTKTDAVKAKNFMRVQLDVDIGEKIYGLGERFTPFVKNGQVVDSWNEDGGTCTEIAYKSVPFYLTNRNYGVFVNDPGPVSHEICSEQVTRVQFSVPGEKIDFMVIGGEDMKDVLRNYTNVTGKPAL